MLSVVGVLRMDMGKRRGSKQWTWIHLLYRPLNLLMLGGGFSSYWL